MNMEKTEKKKRHIVKKSRAERRRGILAHSTRMTRTVTALMLAITCAALAFTQLGFAGLGFNGEYAAYIIVELLPVSLAALLLGSLTGMLMGLFAGAMLLAHATTMPLNFYELTFVTPLTSVTMLGVAGLLLGMLFSFVLRNNPSLIRGSIYIAIVCFVVSWLYSIGFLVNAIVSVALDMAATTTATSSAEIVSTLDARTTSIVLRMGSMDLQTWGDFAIMALSCIAAFIIVDKAKLVAGNMSIRTMFAVRLSIAVFAAFMITSASAFASITQSELNDAKDDMASELSYLWKQIENTDERSEALISLITDSSKSKDLTADQLDAIVRSVSVNGLLDGYSRDVDGTILIVGAYETDGDDAPSSEGDGYIIASNDDRFIEDELLSASASEEIIAAITQSALTGRVTRAVYDEDYKINFTEALARSDYTIRSQIVYVGALEQDGYTIAIMYPASKVFAPRFTTMAWTALSAFVLLIAVFTVVFLLLDCAIVRRIDETNGTLARITAGDLNAKVEVRNTREFSSLSDGVNETVGALKGWIAEAENRIDTELATAKAIQESALPRVFPPYPDILRFDVYAAMKAAREVGGDFYDFFLVGDDCDADAGKLGFIIADVSGKGVPAALFMMKAMTQLRDYMKVGMEVGEAVENANRQLCEGNDEGMFVTVWAGVLDYATGHVDFANAGHNPPLLWQKDGGWRWLTEKSGLPLGLFDGLPYESHSLECGIGDQFLLYTDGVTEAMSADGELYGEARLEALANKDFTMHPRMLVDALRLDIATWAQGAEQSDDITILVLEVGVPPETTTTLTVSADVDVLPHVNEFIHSELDRRLCPKRVQNQLDIAVEELFVNVCHYAYPDATPEEPGSVRVQRTYSADPPSVVVTIIDEGIPYDPLAKPDAVTPDDITDVPIGGLGILMAKKCTDEMHYERLDGSNVLTIVKRW